MNVLSIANICRTCTDSARVTAGVIWMAHFASDWDMFTGSLEKNWRKIALQELMKLRLLVGNS